MKPKPAPARTEILGAPAAERMVTLVCDSCRMALYMSDRKLNMPTWKCPSCGATTRTVPREATG